MAIKTYNLTRPEILEKKTRSEPAQESKLKCHNTELICIIKLKIKSSFSLVSTAVAVSVQEIALLKVSHRFKQIFKTENYFY